MHAGSESNTRAGPVIAGLLSPVIFATQPSGARLPLRIARWPCLYIGFDHGRITSWSARGVVGDVFQVLGHGLAGDRHAVAVQHAVREQHLHHLRNAAGLVQVDRDVACPEGLRSHSTGILQAHALEIVERPRHAGRVCDGEPVQHAVGGAAGGHDHRDGVLDRLPRDDVAWASGPSSPPSTSTRMLSAALSRFSSSSAAMVDE